MHADRPTIYWILFPYIAYLSTCKIFISFLSYNNMLQSHRPDTIDGVSVTPIFHSCSEVSWQNGCSNTSRIFHRLWFTSKTSLVKLVSKYDLTQIISDTATRRHWNTYNIWTSFRNGTQQHGQNSSYLSSTLIVVSIHVHWKVTDVLFIKSQNIQSSQNSSIWKAVVRLNRKDKASALIDVLKMPCIPVITRAFCCSLGDS